MNPTIQVYMASFPARSCVHREANSPALRIVRMYYQKVRTAMRKTLFMFTLLFASAAFAAENPVDRWANAVGGRDKVAAIRSIYREATLEFGGFHGTIKVWHTADGRYRKEEQIATFSSIETFDGANGSVQQGAVQPHKMTGAELEQSISKRFANSNAIFFVFFPERRRGSVVIEGDDTIVFKPEGGIEWRVTLDPQTSLPKTMVHKEGDRTITVTFVSYETVDGIKFEKEIHRSTGDPRFDSVIHFTKTVINPPVDASLFSIEPKKTTSAIPWPNDSQRTPVIIIVTQIQRADYEGDRSPPWSKRSTVRPR